MNALARVAMLGVAVMVISALLYGHARAGGGHYFAPADSTAVKEECGSCHLAYPASMLPARSWQRIMSQLDQHFGSDASIDAKTSADITRFLTSNAGDQAGRTYGEKLLRGVAATDTPLRITELPRWVREHRKVSEREWQHRDVKSRANCQACHSGADRGYFDD